MCGSCYHCQACSQSMSVTDICSCSCLCLCSSTSLLQSVRQSHWHLRFDSGAEWAALLTRSSFHFASKPAKRELHPAVMYIHGVRPKLVCVYPTHLPCHLFKLTVLRCVEKSFRQSGNQRKCIRAACLTAVTTCIPFGDIQWGHAACMSDVCQTIVRRLV